MDLKQKLIDLAREATGDDEIVVAGDFQPKGLTWKMAAGAAAGAAAGGAVDAQGLGAATGALAGRYAGSSGELPPFVVLAASPTRLYVLTSNNAKGLILAKHLVPLDAFDRENLTVEMHQKMTVRTAVITDQASGQEIKVEGKRILFHHMNDMLDALEIHEADDDEYETAVLPDDAAAHVDLVEESGG
jgi:hypothetical protein